MPADLSTLSTINIMALLYSAERCAVDQEIPKLVPGIIGVSTTVVVGICLIIYFIQRKSKDRENQASKDAQAAKEDNEESSYL